uniref:DNA-directed RNA polymerases I, II, and III subunit RPABC5 n=1 Tax=Moschus moschiferus TaxID=68415 RepID=A0A8C6FHI6_MOSMO
MIIPVHCYTCSKIVGNKWEACLGLLQAEYTKDTLDAVILKYLCRKLIQRKVSQSHLHLRLY